ncbi:MAG: caa(3)-type oxidase [Sphingomonadales bacterium]|nr:caa(3)-type oxidase [Sphingomonadales bacterium]MBM3923775.1 caa(3)-type oxidase [Sphingomonadales bacterium]MBM3931513.1 caa(3)-type oxidase [Sphingomonadales bacterium]
MSGEHSSSFDIKGIWMVFWVLFAITAVEFVIALAIPETFMAKPIKNVIYVTLTLLKAFYIVAYFMHLKFERINLIYSILLPTIFVLGVIAALMYESDYWFTLR